METYAPFDTAELARLTPEQVMRIAELMTPGIALTFASAWRVARAVTDRRVTPHSVHHDPNCKVHISANTGKTCTSCVNGCGFCLPID